MSEEIITTPILTSFSHDAVRQEREKEGRGVDRVMIMTRFLKEVQITLQYLMHAMNIEMYFQYPQVYIITKTSYNQRLFETFLSLGGFYY